MTSQSPGTFLAQSTSTGRPTLTQLRVMIFVGTLSFIKQEIKHANLDLNEEISVRRFISHLQSSRDTPECRELALLRWHVTGMESRSFTSFPRGKGLEACSHEIAERSLHKTGKDNGSGQEDVGHPASPSHQHLPSSVSLAPALALTGCLWVSLTHSCGKEQA